MSTANNEQVLMKYGEVTNEKLYQVRGDHHWYSSPPVAIREHRKLKAFFLNGGFKKDRK